MRLTAFNHQDEFIRVVTLHPRLNLHIQSLYDSNEMRKMHPAAIARALADGANPKAVDEYGETALIKAAEGGAMESVRLLLAAGAEINAAAENGRTALAAAVAKGHAEIADLLLKAGADVNAKDRQGESSVDRKSVV